MLRISTFNWLEFFHRLYDKTFDAELFSRAAQAAFYFTFSLFPLLYFLVSVFGIVLESTDGLKAETLAYLQQIMPSAVFELVRRTMEEIVENSTGGKLTLGLVVTLWSASAGVDGIRGALNAIYGLRERRSWWWTKLQSLVLTLIITILAAVILAVVFYGWQLVQFGFAYLGLPVTSPFLLIGIQWISILLLMLFACEVIFNLLPDFRKIRWIWITHGSVVAIGLWFVLTSGFRIYLSFFNTYDKTYGSLGAVMILMLWLYLTALVVMIGGAINAVVSDMNASDTDDTL